jgi:hypothetical protein
MKTSQSSHTINSIAKQLGFTAACWLAINVMGNDRTSESYIGVREGKMIK